MKSLQHYQDVAQQMIEADRERDAMLRAMDDMWHNRWSLPEHVAGLRWIHKVVSSDPHDAIRAGTRVLSSVAPQVKLLPLAGGDEERAKADRIEGALSWHFRNASRRRRASVLRDVVLSALLYDEVVAQVVYLPAQVEALQAFKGEGERLEAAERYGPFAVIVRNPQQVHVRYSDWMPEAVVLKKLLPIEEAVDFWGEKAKRLSKGAWGQGSKGAGGIGSRGARGSGRKDAAEYDYCTVYDYMDAEERVVWAIPQEGGGALTPPGGEVEGAAGGVEILREAHGLGFLPWAAKVGGTTLEEGSGLQRVPLLHSIYESGSWDTQNIVETLLTSEVIAYAAAPRLKIEGPTDNVEVDYGEPGRPAYVPPGHALNPMAAPGMDQGLAVVAQRVAERMGKSTVPRILQTGDFPSGTAFATLNLATQSGIKALTPYKELAEDALAEVLTLMLQWVRQSGDTLRAGVGKAGAKDEVLVKASEIDLAQYFVEVELTADVPTDRMSRINAASMAVRELGYSRQRALEQIGESDPQEVLRQAEQEELAALELDLAKQRKQALAQVETEKLVERLRAVKKEEKAEPAAAEQAQVENQRLKIESQPKRGLGWIAERVKKLVGGQGFDPGRGGSPAAMADPAGEAAKRSMNEGEQ